MSKNDEGLKALLCLLIIFISLPLHILWMSWIFLCLWEWFIVSTFDITSLNMVQSAGIQTLLTLEKCKYTHKNDEDEKALDVLGKLLGLWFLLPGFVFLLGAIISQFM